MLCPCLHALPSNSRVLFTTRPLSRNKKEMRGSPNFVALMNLVSGILCALCTLCQRVASRLCTANGSEGPKLTMLERIVLDHFRSHSGRFPALFDLLM